LRQNNVKTPHCCKTKDSRDSGAAFSVKTPILQRNNGKEGVNVIPGEIITKDRDIILNEGRKTVSIPVSNKGDRPVQVGSHFHFFETNKLLSFDRQSAYGMRLDIPSGTSVRFEPGETKTVQLAELGGRKRVFGLNSLTTGQASSASLKKSLNTAHEKGFIE
jgi:urease beta subunit